MQIPFQLDRMGAGGTVSGDRPAFRSSGCFVCFSDGRIFQAAFTIRNAFLLGTRKEDQFVFSGGTAENTTAGSGASVIVSAGGTVIDAVMNDYSRLVVFSGGTVSGCVAHENDIYASSGAYISGANIKRSEMTIYDNVVVENIHVSSGASLYISGDNVKLTSPCIFYGARISNYGSNLNMNHATIATGGTFCFYSGVNCSHITAMPRATVECSSGAVVREIFLADGASVEMSVYGSDTETVVAGSDVNGNTFHASAGTAFDFIVSSNACQNLVYYGVASRTKVRSDGSQVVSFGAVARETENHGSMIVSSGGTAVAADIRSGAIMYLREYAVVSSASVASGGDLSAVSFASVSDLTVENGGYIYGSLGATFNRATVAGTVNLTAECSFREGTITDGGEIIFVSHANASGLVVSSGGCLYLRRDCFASALSVASGGTAYISAGASALAVRSEAGAYISVASGAYIEYIE